jgi:hypothetical protein
LSQPRARDPLVDLARILERANVDYALIGGHAVNAWLEPRFTADIDLTLQAGPDAMAKLKQALEAEGFALVAEHGAELASGPDFVRFESADTSMTLEVQAAKTELQQELLGRARVLGKGIRVATAEDLIVLKLIANRGKDQVDLRGLVKLSGLDWEYVQRWARAWDVDGLLAELRQQDSRPMT